MDVLHPSGLAYLLEELTPGLGQLIVDDDIVITEALAPDLASHQPSGEFIPGRLRFEVVNPDDKGGIRTSLFQHVAG